MLLAQYWQSLKFLFVFLRAEKSPFAQVPMPNLSLKSRMTLTVSVLVFVIVTTVAGLGLIYFQREFQKSIANQQYTMVSTLAAEIDGKLSHARKEIKGIAAILPPQALTSRQKQQAFLTTQRDDLLTFGNGLYILSPRGILTAGIPVQPDILGRDFSARPYFQNTVRLRKVLISEPFFSAQKSHHPIVMVTVPLLSKKGTLEGVLAGSLDLLQDNFLGELARVKLGKGGYLYIYNSHRELVIHPQKARLLTRVPAGANRMFDKALQGFNGTGETINSRGMHALSSFRHLTTTDWILAANYPYDEAYAPIHRAEHYFLLVLAAVLAISMLVVWVAMGQLIAPLNLFTRHVEQFTANRRQLLLPEAIAGRDEIGRLAGTFKRMLRELGLQEHALREEKTFSESLLQLSPFPCLVLDTRHRVIAWNRACEALTGIPAAEMIGTDRHWQAFYPQKRPTLADLILDGAQERIADFYSNYSSSLLIPDGLHSEGWFHDLAGRSRYLSFDAAPIRNERGELVAVIEKLLDITETKRAEEESARNEQLLRKVLNTLPLGVWIVGPEGRILQGNPTGREIWGGNPQVGIEEYGQFKGWWLDTGRCIAAEEWGAARAIRNGETSLNEEIEIESFSGQRKIIAHSAVPIRDDKGKITGAIVVNQDIGERIRLQEMEKRRQALLQATTEAFLRFLETGVLNEMAAILVERCCQVTGAHLGLLYEPVAGNQARVLAVAGCPTSEQEKLLLREGQERICKSGDMVLSLDRDSLLLKPVQEKMAHLANDLAHPMPCPESVTAGHQQLSAFMGVPLTLGEQVVGVIGLCNKKGGFTAEDRQAMENFARTASLAIQSARTELARHEAAEHLRAVQKFEAIGQLAGGVAHDFNNLLTVINGYSSQLIRALKDNDLCRSDAEAILQAGQRAAALTRQLLAFSRRQVLEPKILDLNELIRGFEKILRRLLHEGILMKINFAADLGRVKADPGQVEQILMNLIVNARDALPRGGNITIETANAELDEAFALRHPSAAAGRYVRFSVRDDGPGMDEAVRRRIFEPFFTTKEQGRGTGLGLSTVYGIVKQSAGYIQVESAPGAGSTFNVYLPRTDERQTVLSQGAATAAVTGKATVLVVEDEMEVLRLVETALHYRAYPVLAAATAAEALSLCGSRLGDIDLLLTDMVLPDRSGPELARELRNRRPGLKVLYMSGYGQFHGEETFVDQADRAFLQKPFTPEELTEKIQILLTEEALPENPVPATLSPKQMADA